MPRQDRITFFRFGIYLFALRIIIIITITIHKRLKKFPTGFGTRITRTIIITIIIILLSYYQRL